MKCLIDKTENEVEFMSAGRRDGHQPKPQRPLISRPMSAIHNLQFCADPDVAQCANRLMFYLGRVSYIPVYTDGNGRAIRMELSTRSVNNV